MINDQETYRDQEIPDIKSRIYQRGFKIGTMPSVKRPSSIQSNMKPLVAKIDKEKNKKQVQSTILHNQKTYQQ
jgi:hypothetical protein